MNRDDLLKKLDAKKQRCRSVVRLFYLFQNGIDWFCLQSVDGIEGQENVPSIGALGGERA